MALRAGLPTWVCGMPAHYSDFDFRRCGFGFNSRWKPRAKWECCCLDVLAQRAITPIEDEKPVTSPEVQQESPQTIHRHKDLNLLPKPLSATDLSSSPDDGSKVRVAYQGIPGAYSEAAALKAYPKCETVPCEQFEAVFQAVELWMVDKAILPFENSITELKHALSHPQALAQCEMTLSNLGIIRVGADDTAGAAKIIAAGGSRDTGAIASARAAEIYGLDIIAEKIQDDEDNITRFLILSREPTIPETGKEYKTSVVFTLEEGPGILFKALAAFTLRGISLTKIESRPRRKYPLSVVTDPCKGSAKYFHYLFYIDIEASMAEPRTQNALKHLQEIATFIRVLGCYPVDNTIS